MARTIATTVWLTLLVLLTPSRADDDTVRVFIFAGQSNMEGADSRVPDIKYFPPFVGLDQPQPEVRFSYVLGRENKTRSDGWEELRPVRNMVGPELSFARHVRQHVSAPIAIVKCAAGGTHLGGDWNPDEPQGFKMYPLALKLVRESLDNLRQQNIKFRLEGFMWHQGENDMFNQEYMANYGKNLANYLARWRRDLDEPKLKFYIGELCTKTIWGMDLRPRMYAISLGQKAVTSADPLAEYIPTSHIGVEIGNPVGLHYHYGTLGQLEHGVNYAEAYLRTIGKTPPPGLSLDPWPFREKSEVQLFILAGHRNMEGERSFVQELRELSPKLVKANAKIAYKYSIGGGVKRSGDWEPLGPAGYYDTFGPEVSFGPAIADKVKGNVAVAKFTHGGSQIIDWTPEGSLAKSRNLYAKFIAFIRKSVEELEAKGHRVRLAGVFYHVGENDMSMHSYRKQAPQWLQSTITQSRVDLESPELRWYLTQQSPTDHKSVNKIDVTAALAELAREDDHLVHITGFTLPPQRKRIVLDTAGILKLGEIMAASYVSE